MARGIGLVVLATIFVTANGLQDITNYEISRNKLGFGLREIAEFFLGGGYGHYPTYPGHHGPGQYPGNYPSGPGNYPSGPGNYPSGPGNYPGNYPSHPGIVGEPGAHPGCPLCDSSVYSYCSQKQIHDACCCENPSLLPFNCRNKDCKFLYANSCQEYGLITNCCCIDLQKQNVAPAVPVIG